MKMEIDNEKPIINEKTFIYFYSSEVNIGFEKNRTGKLIYDEIIEKLNKDTYDKPNEDDNRLENNWSVTSYIVSITLTIFIIVLATWCRKKRKFRNQKKRKKKGKWTVVNGRTK
eukprot:GAHX01005359.1.p1 GENE.GAHX01005359.1~~GAHX01005359.1.p1  ORF type:complete len:114 (+),score=19.03 GAHX01005359.1:215-556(+)